MSDELFLNIGAGHSHIPGFRNIDVSDRAEITLNLSEEPLPFADNSVDLVFSYHTLEHVPDYLFALSEIHRVLKHGGRFLIGVPYVSSTEHHLVNPYHLHNFNEHSFDFFDASKWKGSAAEENDVLFQKVFHRYHYVGMFHLVPPPFRSWCRRHLFNVVRKIDFGLVAIKKPGEMPTFDASFRKEMLDQFLQCMRSRVPYDSPPAERRGSLLMRRVRTIRRWWLGRNE